MFLSDTEAFVRCQGIFESENFDQKLKEGAEFIKHYVDEYKVMPELDIVNSSCGTQFKDASSVGQEHTDWLLDTLQFLRVQTCLKKASMVQLKD